jgi:signal transduction histidine kinase
LLSVELCRFRSVSASRQDMLRWLAHETRVPLNSLFMGLQLLSLPQSAMNAALPPDHDEILTLGHCRSAAEALIAVLSDVLDLT